MTPAIRAALAEHKADLLAGLVEANPLDQVVDEIGRRRGVEPVAVDGGQVIEPSPEPWPPRPAELARWPLVWRQRWGLLANELEDQGVPWPEHERRAFALVKAERKASP
jgi:hypothetical protein